MKRTTIRGVRIEREAYVPREPLENLRFTIEVEDDSGRVEEILGRLASLDPASVAFDECVRKHPGKLIFLKHNKRVIRRSDRPE